MSIGDEDVEFINLIEATPNLYSKKCKAISLFLRLFLQYATVLCALGAWYLYDFFIALLALVLAFIVIGIIRSKLRNSVIPTTQREFHYNDKAIAQWYSAKMLCDEALMVH